MRGITPEPAGAGSEDRFEVVTVEAQNRVRLKGAPLRVHLEWLTKETVFCVARRGWYGGLAFVAETYLQEAAEAEIQPEEGLDFTYFSTAPSDTPNGVAQLRVPLVYEPSRDRYSLALPEKVRKLRLVPSAGETAVVLTVHNSLQVWWPDLFDLYSQLRPEEIEEKRQARLDLLVRASVRPL